MGKIVNMQMHQSQLGPNYIKKTNPKLDTKGIKNFYNKLRLAYKPGIENEYKLTSSQYKFARRARAGTLISIGILASSLSIGTVVSNHISRANLNENTNSYENTILDRSIVMENAKNALNNIVLPDGAPYTHQAGIINYIRESENGNINSIEVNQIISSKQFSVYRYISGNAKNKNNPEIFNSFMDQYIKVANSSNPSQIDLQKLDDLVEIISNMNLSLDKKTIIDLDQIEKDNER